MPKPQQPLGILTQLLGVGALSCTTHSGKKHLEGSLTQRLCSLDPWFSTWLHKRIIWKAFTNADTQAPASVMMAELTWGAVQTSPFNSSPDESQVLPVIRTTDLDPNFPREHLEELCEMKSTHTIFSSLFCKVLKALDAGF